MIKELVSKVCKHADKVLHFLACYGVTMTFMVSGYWLVGVILSVILSIVKELFDQWSYGGFSWGDILADVVGILSALIIGGVLMR